MNLVQLTGDNLDEGTLPAEYLNWLPIAEALLKISKAAVTCWYNPRSGYCEVVNHDLVVMEASSRNELHSFYAGMVIALQNNNVVGCLLPLSVNKH